MKRGGRNTTTGAGHRFSPHRKGNNMKYRVAVTETRRKIVEVEASTAREAYVRTRDAYDNTEFMLDETNFEGTEYYVLDTDEYTDSKVDTIERKDV